MTTRTLALVDLILSAPDTSSEPAQETAQVTNTATERPDVDAPLEGPKFVRLTTFRQMRRVDLERAGGTGAGPGGAGTGGGGGLGSGTGIGAGASGAGGGAAASTAAALEGALGVSGRVEGHDIYFSFNSDRPHRESDPTLRAIAALLPRHADWRLAVEGHTDGVASDAANLDLSRRRAAAVRRALVEDYKVDGSRLTTDGSGEPRPKDTNDTLKGRARNRRVELVRR